jgi:cytoskeletal protein RodZ
MDELGTILRETREARGLDLEQVSKITRIRPRFLEALEEERYDVLPTPVHVRGFLRNYALFLNLDPEPLINRYKASRRMVKDIPLQKQVRPELEKAPSLPPETLDDEFEDNPVFYRPLGNKLQTPAWFSSEILIGIVLIIGLLALIGWAGSRYIIPMVSGTEETETPVAEITPSQPIPTAIQTAMSTSTPAPTQPTEEATVPPIVSSIILDITAIESNWLYIEVDGEVVQEGMVEANDLFSWEGVEMVKLRTGNAAGLDVTLNGQNLGQLGSRGEVVEKIWTLSGEMQPTPTLTVIPSNDDTTDTTETTVTPTTTE